MTPDPSLAHFARELQRVIPRSLPPFDAEAFLNGTYQLPAELQVNPKSQLQHPEYEPPIEPPVEPHQFQPEQVPESTTSNYPPTTRVVHPSESGSTTSNYLRDPRKKCRGITASGTPCKAYRLKGGDLCLFHDAHAAEDLQQARSRGGQAVQAKHRDSIDFELLGVDLHSLDSLLAFTEGLLRMQLAGSIPLRQCSQILRTLRIAERALSADASPKPLEHLEAVQAFVQAAPTLAEHLNERETDEQAREIESTAAKRQEYLKANRQYGHDQPKPAPNRAHIPSPFANHPFLHR